MRSRRQTHSRWSTEASPKAQRRRRSPKSPRASSDRSTRSSTTPAFAGIYFSKHFTDYTVDDLRALVSVNIEGFLFITQFAIKQMLVQKTGGSIVNITTLVDHPIAGINSAVPMITKGGLEAVTRSLAMDTRNRAYA